MQVPVQISFHGIDKSEAVESRIRAKVSKLEQFFDRITGCRVVVEKHHHGTAISKGQPFLISIVVEVPGEELVVKREPKSGEALKKNQNVNIAVRDAFDTMQRQLKEYVARRWRDPRHIDVRQVAV